MGKSMRDLRDLLCDELEVMTEHGSLSGDRLKVIDMLTHSIKSIDTILAMENNGYSNEGRRRRYSYNDKLTQQLEDMMRKSNDHDRDVIKRFMEQMGM